MSQTARISHQQLGAVVVLFSLSATLVYAPAQMAEAAGPDAWLGVPLGTLAGAVPIAYLLSRLAVFHPRRSIGEVAEQCLGRWLGKAVTLVLAAYSLFLASLVLRNVLDLSVVVILPGTPMAALGTVFMVAVVYGVYCGVEVITRLAVLIMISALLAVAGIPVGIMPEVDLVRLLPLLGHGVSPALRAAWIVTGWFAELWIFGAWIGLVDKPKYVFRGFMWGLLGASSGLTVLVISAVVTFGAELTRRFAFPTYSLVQEISLTEILERMELPLLTVWLASMFIKVCVCLWSATSTTTTALGLKTDRRIILPLAGVVVLLSLQWPSIVYLINFGTDVWTPFTLPMAWGTPILLTVISWWRQRRGRGQAA